MAEMAMPVRISVGCVLLSLAWLVVGCAAKTQPDTYLVSGVVTLDGQPVANASVTFLPRGSTRGSPATCMTDADGKYAFQPERGQGVRDGEFTVTISRLKELAAGQPEATPEVGMDNSMPAPYGDPQRTALSANVPAGGAVIDFALKSR